MKKSENETVVIIEKLQQGASLRIVMTPDGAIPTNLPLHDETFDLSHVLISGDSYCGMTFGDLVVDPTQGYPVSLYYTSCCDLFGGFSPLSAYDNRSGKKIKFTVGSTKRYRKLKWHLVDDYELIWESTGKADYQILREAVSLAKKFKIAFLDEENIWNIHPVILPQVNVNDDSFVMKTSLTIYPYFLRQKEQILSVVDKNKSYFMTRSAYQANMLHGEVAPFFAFYQIFNDYTHKTFYDLVRKNTTNKHFHLKVFTEK